MTLDDLKLYFKSQIDSIEVTNENPSLYYMVETVTDISTDDPMKFSNITVEIRYVKLEELDTLLLEELEFLFQREGKPPSLTMPRFRKVTK